ncbi:MAG: hypothetical protein WBM86_08790, partial [Waterburya sp.]
MSSSQMRLNLATGEWVIYAPSRRKRPHDFQTKKPIENISPKDLETCPFCPGNENVLQSKILEFPASGEVQW